jgi:Cu(I)/Ag(I) efflux system membrane fusion protein
MHLAAKLNKPAVTGTPVMNAQGAIIRNSVRRASLDLQTVVVEQSPENDILRATGRVTVDQSRVYSISSGVSGWIREVKDHAVGSRVEKGETLASYYSPELTAMEQAYLVATERMSGAMKQLAAQGTESAAARLRNSGMGEKQVAEIASTRRVPANIDVTAPADGFIVSRDAAVGERFDKGKELYRLADLSHVWIEAEVSDSEARNVKPGMPVVVTLPSSGVALKAQVGPVLPQFQSGSRKKMLRLDAENPGFVLRPGMIVDLKFETRVDPALSIPVDALLNTGVTKQVFVAHASGDIETRQVTTGSLSANRVEILRGLKAGERIVASARYMLDSESQLSSEASAPLEPSRASQPQP